MYLVRRKKNCILFFGTVASDFVEVQIITPNGPFPLSRPKRLRCTSAESYQIPRSPYPTWCKVATIFIRRITIQTLWRQHVIRPIITDGAATDSTMSLVNTFTVRYLSGTCDQSRIGEKAHHTSYLLSRAHTENLCEGTSPGRL